MLCYAIFACTRGGLPETCCERTIPPSALRALNGTEQSKGPQPSACATGFSTRRTHVARAKHHTRHAIVPAGQEDLRVLLLALTGRKLGESSVALAEARASCPAPSSEGQGIHFLPSPRPIPRRRTMPLACRREPPRASFADGTTINPCSAPPVIDTQMVRC